jgi:hypothetical protein
MLLAPRIVATKKRRFAGSASILATPASRIRPTVRFVAGAIVGRCFASVGKGNSDASLPSL